MDTTSNRGDGAPAPLRPYDALMALAGPFAAQGCDLVLLHAEEAWLVATVAAPAITADERLTLAGALAGALNAHAGVAPPGPAG